MTQPTRTVHAIVQDLYWLGKEDYDPDAYLDKWAALLKELYAAMLAGGTYEKPCP